MQDCDEDWQKESAAMSSIYGHAFITIIAMDSRDVRDGILRKRELDSQQPRESTDGIYDRGDVPCP